MTSYPVPCVCDIPSLSQTKRKTRENTAWHCGEILLFQAATSENPSRETILYVSWFPVLLLSCHRGGMWNVPREPNKLVNKFDLSLVSIKTLTVGPLDSTCVLSRKSPGLLCCCPCRGPELVPTADLPFVRGLSPSAAWSLDRAIWQPSVTNPAGDCVKDACLFPRARCKDCT